MIVVGIDPGLSGAIARYDSVANTLEVHDMPTFMLERNGKKKRDVDLPSAARIIDNATKEAGTRICIEQVSSMPGQGVSSVFAFGKAYGIVLGICAATFCPLETVTPAVWKRGLSVPSMKDGARARASALLPMHAHLWTRVKDDGRAEASLLAYWLSTNGERR